MLTAVVIAAALVAGVTGAWSPCGFSMVETLAPGGYAQRLQDHRDRLRDVHARRARRRRDHLRRARAARRRARRQRALRGRGDRADRRRRRGRNLRIVPQVRRQVPESWRRVMPVPLAAGLYGVLLGLGFTTFILTFAVWALAGISVAVGDPAIGVAIGLAFGVGRALPVIALAPSGGGRLHAAMAEQPRILRSLRALDAAALAVAALTLATAPAQAAVSVFAVGYADAEPRRPAARPAPPRRPGRDPRPEGTRTLPGNHPAIGGGQFRLRRSAGRSRSRAARRSRRPAPTRSRSPRPGWPGARRAPSTPRRCTRPRSRARSSPATSAARCSRATCSSTTIDGRIESTDLEHRRAPAAAPRGARGAARPVGRRLPPDLHQGDLQAPAGADRRPAAAAHDARTARSTAPRPRPGATPATSRAATTPAATSTSRSGGGPPAGVSDTLTTTATSAERRLLHPRPPAARRRRARADVVRVDL